MKRGSSALASRKQAKCTHPGYIVVRSHRIERRICEDCGHVSFEISDEGLVYGRRDKFAREVDREVDREPALSRS